MATHAPVPVQGLAGVTWLRRVLLCHGLEGVSADEGRYQTTFGGTATHLPAEAAWAIPLAALNENETLVWMA